MIKNIPLSSDEMVLWFPDMKVTFVSSSPPPLVNLASDIVVTWGVSVTRSTKLLIGSAHLSETFNIMS